MEYLKKFFIAAAACLWCFAAVAPASAADPYQIDAILSLTGPFSFLGTAEATSLRSLEPLLNARGGIDGRPVHFAIVDDQSQPAVAVQLANAIIARHPVVMLGPNYGASCLAVAPLIKSNNGPVQYCFAPTIHPPPGSYTFSAGSSSRDYAFASLNFAQAKGWKRLALIATNDSTGQDIEGQFSELVTEPRFHDLTFVDREHFNATDVSIAAQLAKIKAQNVDAVVPMTVGTATGTVLRGLSDAGLANVPIVSNVGNLLKTQLDQYASIMPNEIYFCAPRFYSHDVSRSGPVRDAQIAFYEALRRHGIDQPDAGDNFPWDATLIVVDGLRTLGPTATPKALLDYMLAVHAFAGTNGIYDFRDGSQRGQGLNAIVMVRWNPALKRVVTVSEYGGKPLLPNAR